MLFLCHSAAGESRWANDALVWLALRAEIEPERRDIECAMATSLREAEDVQAEVPLEQRKTAELIQHFKGSVVLAQVCWV